MRTYIYIACRSHSGSTLLEKLLATSPDVLALGEICHFMPYAADPSKICSCGLSIATCAFWRPVLERLHWNNGTRTEECLTDGYRSRRNWENLIYCAALLSAPPVLGVMEHQRGSVAWHNLVRTRRHWRAIDAVAELNPQSILVDKSMAASRLMEIARSAPAGYRMCAIHLVRDGRANAHSHRELFRLPVDKGARQWRQINRNIEFALWHLAEMPRMLVHYEDLCENPVRVLSEIAERFALRSQFSPELLARTIHAIGGNQARLTGYATIEPDQRFLDGLSARERVGFDRVAGAMNRQYGYG